jgi:hypothetical protein
MTTTTATTAPVLKRGDAARTVPMTDLTAPVRAHTLAAKVALVEQYAPDAEWTISERPAMGRAWVLMWDRLALTVGDLGDLDLARYVVAERTRARQQLRRIVVAAAVDLGLNPGPFRHPARVVVNAGLTKCPGCACNVVARSHRPGSEECRAARVERLISIAD